VNLDDLFPAQVLEKQLKFDQPYLDYQSFTDIMKIELEKVRYS